MSTSRITIVKIAGKLADEINILFQNWFQIYQCACKLEGELINVEMHENPLSHKCVSLLRLLEKHCGFASVSWFQQFIDSWSIAPCLHVIEEFKSLSEYIRTIRSDRLDILIVKAPDRVLTKFIKKRTSLLRNQRGYPTELRYLLNQLKHCAKSWQAFLESKKISTIILIFFEAIGPSVLDCDVMKMAEIVPDWFLKEKDKS